MKRLELPAVGPKPAARTPARVSVAIPLTDAARLLPVAELDLTVRAETLRGNVEGSYLAVGVDAHAVPANAFNRGAIVLLARAIVVVEAIEAERGNHADAGVRVSPQGTAVAAGLGVPARKVADGDTVAGGNVGARLARLDVVELVAVLHEVWLDGAGCMDAVARVGGRGLPPNDGGAGVRVGPEARTGTADPGVPGGELLLGDAVGGGDGGAVLALLDKVEPVAVVYHVRLNWQRCLDA